MTSAIRAARTPPSTPSKQHNHSAPQGTPMDTSQTAVNTAGSPAAAQKPPQTSTTLANSCQMVDQIMDQLQNEPVLAGNHSKTESSCNHIVTIVLTSVLKGQKELFQGMDVQFPTDINGSKPSLNFSYCSWDVNKNAPAESTRNSANPAECATDS